MAEYFFATEMLFAVYADMTGDCEQEEQAESQKQCEEVASPRRSLWSVLTGFFSKPVATEGI